MLQILVKNLSNNVVLIRETSSQNTAVSTFDHNDLNAYLLVVVGLAHPPEESVTLYDTIVKKAQAHERIPLRDIQVSLWNYSHADVRGKVYICHISWLLDPNIVGL